MKSISRFFLAPYFLVIASGLFADDQELPLIDAHIHYSHDAWEIVPTSEAVEILRSAGLQKVFVSSSSDEGTQRLFQAAPDLVIPVLRPYRKRGELSSWMHDETVVTMLKERLQQFTYAGLGEFHAFGDDLDLPVLREVVSLAQQYKLFLHAHSDIGGIHRIFSQDPNAIVLWAHSGFEGPQQVGEMLARYPRLWSDLAFRTEHAENGVVDNDWRRLFEQFPDRFLIGTDTYTPQRWSEVVAHAEWSRQWLRDLPQGLRKAIAFRNAELLIEAAKSR